MHDLLGFAWASAPLIERETSDAAATFWLSRIVLGLILGKCFAKEAEHKMPSEVGI